MMAWTLWYLGYPQQALDCAKEALKQAGELSHPFSLGFALSRAAMFYELCRDREAAQKSAEATISLTTEQGFSFWSALGTATRGWALADQGNRAEGIAQLHQGLVAQRATGAGMFRSFFLAALAEAHERERHPEEGLVVLAEALTMIDKTGECYHAAEIHRLRGELLLMKDPPSAEPDRCFRTAVEIARKQNAKSLELRATTTLARLLDKRGRRDEACAMLTEIYGWFTEGFDTADLKDAKALLNKLNV